MTNAAGTMSPLVLIVGVEALAEEDFVPYKVPGLSHSSGSAGYVVTQFFAKVEQETKPYGLGGRKKQLLQQQHGKILLAIKWYEMQKYTVQIKFYQK